MLTQEPIYKPSSIFYFKPILLSAHKLTLYGDNNNQEVHQPNRQPDWNQYGGNQHRDNQHTATSTSPIIN